MKFEIESRDRLDESLKRMKALLEERREVAGYTDLEYHLAQKIRLAHARTHATANRRLSPEFALGVIEDLTFLLTEWGLATDRHRP